MPKGKPNASLAVNRLAGIAVEVSNLEAAHAFYRPIFRNVQGTWQETNESLTFSSVHQSIEFIRHDNPRVLADEGQHQAYTIRENHFHDLVKELSSAGHAANWWREDHPAERVVTAYFSDPSGNRVQLLPVTSDDATLLAHAAVVVHDLEKAEDFYLAALGGKVDYYYGTHVDHEIESKVWGEGKDPCAPWTRRSGGNYPGHPDPRVQPRPRLQMFVRFGSGIVGVMLANEDYEEPPEEMIRGTPRLILQCGQKVGLAASYLSDRALSFEQEGRCLFLRDFGGNFIQLTCEE